MANPIKKPESYSPKTKPEILSMAESAAALPERATIPYSGAMEQDGAAFGPHTLAFASAVTALALLLGAPHDTEVMVAHNRFWRNDNDYFRHMMVSGEAFLFWNDVWEYFTDTLLPLAAPQYNGSGWECAYTGAKDAAPLLDCLHIAGIQAELYANGAAQSVQGGWESPQALAGAVLRNLADGLPVLLFSGEPGDKILLAAGYENGGETLLAWTFTAGDRGGTNTKFSVQKCKKLQNWTENILAAALVTAPFSPPQNSKTLLHKALARGAQLLRTQDNIGSFRETFLAKGRPRVHPEIWDLAERRCYLANAIKNAAKALETDKLTPAADAAREIHDKMWQIHAIWQEKKTKAAKLQIAEILSECKQLDSTIADTICAFLAD